MGPGGFIVLLFAALIVGLAVTMVIKAVRAPKLTPAEKAAERERARQAKADKVWLKNQ